MSEVYHVLYYLSLFFCLFCRIISLTADRLCVIVTTVETKRGALMKSFLLLISVIFLSWTGLGVDWKYDTDGRTGMFLPVEVCTAVNEAAVEPWEASFLGVLSAETEMGFFDARAKTDTSASGFSLSFMDVPMCLILR
jgi:hypothetical protein